MKRTLLAQPPLDGRDFRRLLDGQLKEAPWQKQVEAALDVYGWWWMHIPPNVVLCPLCRTRIYRGIRKGFPDILAIKPPHILWIECKTEHGHVDPEQQRVKAMLEASGQVVVHVRPRDRAWLFALIAEPKRALKDDIGWATNHIGGDESGKVNDDKH
jgi:hypothetical protein